MTSKEYHSRPEISKSGLDMIAKSPAHYWDRYLKPDREEKEPTASMMLGSVVHDIVFNQGEWVKEPAVNKRTNAGKAALEAFYEQLNEGQCAAPSSVFEEAERIAAAVMAHPTAAKLIKTGQAEQPIFCEMDGVKVKIKPDWVNTKYRLCVDLKTTRDASPLAFAKSCSNFRYHVQDAFYTDVMQAAGHDVNGFVFIAVETAPPYNVAIYQLGPEEQNLGREKYKQDLQTFAECSASNKWPGYSKDITVLNFPSYLLK